MNLSQQNFDRKAHQARCRCHRTVGVTYTAALSMLLAQPGHVDAAIVSGGTVIAPPASVLFGGTVAPFQVGFDEVQSFTLPVDVEIDPGGAVIPEGTVVDSHFILLDSGGATITDVVTWTFDGPIIGVMSDQDGVLEAQSSGLLGIGGTAYPAAPISFRGLEASLGDGYTITGPNEIEVVMNVTSPGDFIRVITCPPEACIDFEDVPPLSVFPCMSSFTSGGTTINVNPLSCVGTCNFAAVGVGGGVVGSGKEVTVNNVDLEFETGGVKVVTLRFLEQGGSNTLSINGTNLSPCPTFCFDDFNPGTYIIGSDEFDVTVTFDAGACTFTDVGTIKIVALTGCIDTFAIGGQELVIDDVCLCEPCPGSTATPCTGDINGDGTVGPADLAIQLGAWGPCPGCPADLNDDGTVGPADLALLLGNWGDCPR